MFNFLKTYINPFEKKVDSFLVHLNQKSSKQNVQQDLLNLMQENIAILNLWLEKKAKNYPHLKNNLRLEKYANLKKTENIFQIFWQKKDFLSFPQNQFFKTFSDAELERLQYLWGIMSFCRIHFVYQESSSFDKLLVDLTQEKMLGDCNQIVTFYIHLYSLKFKVSDLEIKLYKGHVALFFQGIEIEATNGSFVFKTAEKGKILNVTEIISINLLDISDFRLKSKSLDSNVLLKTARLAFLLSSSVEVVQNNLDIALSKIALELIIRRNYNLALSFINQIQGETRKTLFQNLIYSAVTYFVSKHNFTIARFFAKKQPNHKLEDFIVNKEVFYWIEKFNFKKAENIAYLSKDQKLIKYTLEQEYFFRRNQLKNIKTLMDVRRHRRDFEILLSLAKKLNNPHLIKWPQDILKQIKN